MREEGRERAGGGQPSSGRLLHPAFEAEPAVALAEARLSGRRRLGVLLQGAAVLAHLASAGRRLDGGWRAAALAGDGLLCGLASAPGRDRRLVQERLIALLALLFGTSGAAASPERVEIAGRGAARRAARELAHAWLQTLAPIAPHRAVGAIFDAAPFLWEREVAADRRALVAELEPAPGERRVLVALPGGGRLAAPGASAAELRDLLVSGEARRRLARLEPAASPTGRWRRAAERYRDEPPATAGERFEHAEALVGLGRLAAAAEVLARVPGPQAAALRLRCRLLLGERRAVRRALGRLEGTEMPTAVLLDLAETAQRAFAGSARPAPARRWLERAAAAAATDTERARAAIIAAGAAWDTGEGEAIARHLEAARPAVEEGGEAAATPAARDLRRRWHHARALQALAAADGAAMVEQLALALAADRRALPRHEAGGLWNDLGIGRARQGDLAGAERALLHAGRLLAGCDGPRGTTLALTNLAEVRLRRGRTLGVAQILDRSLAANRLAGNLRGMAQDLALQARHELVLGRPEAALVRCRDALGLIDAAGSDWHRPEIELFRARALGWLGRPAEAAAALERVAAATLAELEPEERPAVHALAGLGERARRAAGGTAYEALWTTLLEGVEPPVPLWRPIAALEPYRAARFVYDAELLRPGVTPAPLRRQAVASLRFVGAVAPADRLEAAEGRSVAAWQALAAHAEAGAAAARDPAAWRRLFAAAGHPEARLELRTNGSPPRGNGPEILVGGAGGEAEIAATLEEGGRLVLATDLLDPPARALFSLLRRDLESGAEGREESAASPASNGASSAEWIASNADTAARRGIVGASPALAAALERLPRLAAADLPVLVLGESGTGKELVARAVHRGSARRDRPFLAVNSAALSESLLLSDLFGHVRGAFTGADRDRVGVFEAAAGGTVFLDEIGDLPPAAQGMLLRLLQEGEIRRLGESEPRRVDARVVAATHRDLEAMIGEGSFRRDLYYRLRVARIDLPPLRDRGDDVLLLARHFLERAGADAGKAPPRLAPAARARLLAHSWPGNVRELENVLKVAVALAADGVVEPEHLDLPAPGRAPAGDYHARVDALRRRLVEDALAATAGNQAAAARRLGLTRQAMSYLVRRLGVG